MDTKTTTQYENINKSFIKQRRNLIIISIVIVLVYSAGLKFIKISLLGNIAEIPNPKIIPIILWVAWGYWLLRYYQLFNDLGDKKILKKIRHTIDSNIPRNKSVNEIPPPIKKSQLYMSKEDIDSVLYDDLDIFQRSICRYTGMIKGYTLYYGGGRAISRQTAEIEIEIKFNELILPRTKAYLNFIFKTRLFTEYIFPFFIAIFPVVYLLYCVFISFDYSKWVIQ